jgi:tetratricopeptide (TPR) repeat protein
MMNRSRLVGIAVAFTLLLPLPGVAGMVETKARPFSARPRLIAALGLMILIARVATAEPVSFSQGKREVPTYTFGRSEIVAPLFKPLENMGLYPYTILDWDSRAERPVPVQYESLVLENEYLRAEFLPELGGRIWSAYDKIAGREIFYHPTVIKPARYNQRGGWPVGNLELYGPFDAHMLTWPGEPWAWALKRHNDGSATVVLSHVDHFFRDKISLEVTLRPARAFLETTIRLENKNLIPNRYMLWINAGVAATEGSRFVYPMTRTIGHDSSALDTWPIVNGVDLSWNRNNKNMLGVFGLDIYDNFMSIYDYRSDYGTICCKNRLMARGMKTWTFGSGLTALRHMAVYTDKDGLYMETQSGRFIWDGNYEFIDPGKTDGWTEYWYGAGNLGGLTTATQDVAAFLELPKQRPGTAELSVTPTGTFPRATLELFAGGRAVWSSTQDLAVGSAFRSSIPLDANSSDGLLNLRVRAADGSTLLDYHVYPDGSHPKAVYASDSIPRKFGPPDALQVEELYQKGLGHEKFGQIADAEAAYRMALSRDPLFSPVQLRLGLLALERFQYDKAISHFDKVLERDPTNGDAHYFIGIAYEQSGKRLEAERHYYRILPSSGEFERRDYMLALLALEDGNREDAGVLLSRAASATPLDLSVRQAHAYILRKTGRYEEARNERDAILAADPTNAFAQAERRFGAESPGSESRGTDGADSAGEALRLMDQACSQHPQGYLELATEYMRLSAWEEAGSVLDHGLETGRTGGGAPYPLLLYYRAYVHTKQGARDAAKRAIEEARRQVLELTIFPFRSEDVKTLECALELEPEDSNAAVLLGDLLYSRDRRDEGIAAWRRAVGADPGNFFALRDLGMAMLIRGEKKEGLKLLTRASEARPDHMATTSLVASINARLGNAAAAREVFRRALDADPGSDALIERLASVEAQLGNDARALELLSTHTFEATHQSYALLHLYRAVQLMQALDAYSKSDTAGALAHVNSAAQPPSSLGVDDYATVRSSRLLVFEALLQQAEGNASAAGAAWKAAAATSDDDVESEGLFRAIALVKIGERQKADAFFTDFAAVNDQRKSDGNMNLRTHAYYISGIYAAFKGDDNGAAASFRRALEIDESFLYARQALAWVQAGLLKGLRE